MKQLAVNNRVYVRSILAVLMLMFVLFPIFAQDFGFGDEDGLIPLDGGTSSENNAVSISGEISASLLGYVDDFSDGLGHTNIGDIFSGKLGFLAGNSYGDAVINMNLSPTISPITFDESYIRIFFGKLEIEGGLRKLTWGKADSFGPLDVINPLDNTELTNLTDFVKLKIPRPLLHASYRFGQFSKVEAVFVPTFEPHRLAQTGRWAPAQLAGITESIGAQIVEAANPAMQQYISSAFARMMPVMLDTAYPKTNTLDYAQTGLRFTTTIGPADLGIQYYYGRLPYPAFNMTDFAASIAAAVPVLSSASNQDMVNAALADIVSPSIDYNHFHQIGVDWAQVLLGFNLRAELAANITEDIVGDNGTVYNSSLAWSFGFDRDLVWGINLNLQVNETIRVRNNKVNSDPMLDIEAGTDTTSTRMSAVLSKKFFRDELEARFTTLWGIEDKDFLITPALVWTKEAVSVELSGGIFGGDIEGQFGQYHNNGFVKTSLTYSF